MFSWRSAPSCSGSTGSPATVFLKTYLQREIAGFSEI